MEKIKDYIFLHLSVMMFSFTSVFSKFASIQYNRHGLHSPMLYVFLFLMIANCGIYAIAWQQVIKKFELSIAYANKAVTLVWALIWGIFLFHEQITIGKVIGIVLVMLGILILNTGKEQQA